MLFAPDIEEAIQRFAKQEGVSREEALSMILRDWLVGLGVLAPGGDEDDSGD